MFQMLMLDVWREVCRHIDLEQSVHRIARLLAHSLPLDQLRLLTFDWSHATIHTRITTLREGDAGGGPASRTVRASDRKLLEAWTVRQEVLLHQPGDDVHAVAALLLGPGQEIEGSWLAVPLRSEQGRCGALLLRAVSPEAFTSQHRRLSKSLMEPFSVALDNDHRLHELGALRERAEADKRSALTRLGRDDLMTEVVGDDTGLRAVMDRVSLVAYSDLPVLILGETGTGKEVIARTIHQHSPRAEKPFIRVNCGAIPAELIDSELFGHEKGAFTGATGSRKGWFERADEGTLLLDEIGELPLPAQVRLLRVLQESTFERVGAEHATHVNVRIIAATHRDLPLMVQRGQFREDLWYRIAGFPILLPPLRERKQDIADLASHFAHRAAKRFGLRVQEPSVEDIVMLQGYDWPGNIRELASVIDRAAILGQGTSLAVAKALGTQEVPTPSSSLVKQAVLDAGGDSSVATLDDAVRGHIERVLAHTRGRIEGPQGAAAILDVNPHTLRSRMRKLGIAWGAFR